MCIWVYLKCWLVHCKCRLNWFEFWSKWREILSFGSKLQTEPDHVNVDMARTGISIRFKIEKLIEWQNLHSIFFIYFISARFRCILLTLCRWWINEIVCPIETNWSKRWIMFSIKILIKFSPFTKQTNFWNQNNILWFNKFYYNFLNRKYIP